MSTDFADFAYFAEIFYKCYLYQEHTLHKNCATLRLDAPKYLPPVLFTLPALSALAKGVLLRRACPVGA